MDMHASENVARINGVALHRQDETLAASELRQRACTELLRQTAQRNGMLSQDDLPAADGAISEAASEAIERLLERELKPEPPTEEACRRHYAAHLADYTVGERIHLRHILLAVTPGVDVVALRARAEQLLVELRCADPASDAFAKAAERWSNCPSSTTGGDLGKLGREDCADEFAREVFGGAAIGVLPRLVHSRFGFHIVELLARDEGSLPPFEAVASAVAQTLKQHAWVSALRHYLQTLATAAKLEGVAIDTE